MQVYFSQLLLNRSLTFFLLALTGFGSELVYAQEKSLSSRKGYRLVDQLFDEDDAIRRRAKTKLIKAKDLTLAPALMEAVFFSNHGHEDVVAVLESYFDVEYGRNFKAWVTLIGSREDIEPKPGYIEYKARLHGWIDPNLAKFLDKDFPRTIRVEEIIWGGVKKDGIPALKNPPFIPASQATNLSHDEMVFGVSINGDTRAYPFRIMDWHEMANDVVGGQPVSLSYCTLCGAGILFDTRRANGGAFTFGSSGFLYRSNKLMYDHQTQNLWSNLTGKPVMGDLVGKGMELPVLPLVVTTWGEWLAKNPDTKVLSTETGFERDYRPGAAYGEYFASPELMFPVWKAPPDEPDLAKKDLVWVVVSEGNRKAYPINDLRKTPVLMDEIKGNPVVLITNPKNGAVRAYEAGANTLEMKDGSIVDGQGRSYRQSETALTAVDGTELARLPGHRTFWFSWGAFFPDTEYYRRKP